LGLFHPSAKADGNAMQGNAKQGKARHGKQAPHLLALPVFGFAPFRLCFLQDERYITPLSGASKCGTS